MSHEDSGKRATQKSKQTRIKKIRPKIACCLCEWEQGCIRILSARARLPSSSFFFFPLSHALYGRKTPVT